MNDYLKKSRLHNLVSPYTLALISYAVFLFAWSFPPGLYTSYTREVDLMFLDLQSLLFVSICVLAFFIGVRLATGLGSFSSSTLDPTLPRSPLVYLSVPLIGFSCCCLVYLLKVGSHIDLVGLLTSSQGNSIKLANQTGQLKEGVWGRSPSLLCATLWWAQYRAHHMRLKGVRRLIFVFVFVFALLVDVLTCAGTVNRTNLMPLMSGIALIYLFRKSQAPDARVLRLLTSGALAVAAFFGIFLLLSVVRGSAGSNQLIGNLMGYSIASYNRLALMLAGNLKLAVAGTGIYLCPSIAESDTLNAAFHIRDKLGWPDSDALWRMEFGSIATAGLNRAFNWVSLFGYLFTDIGWFAPAYFSGLGMLCGRIWLSFKRGTACGVVLYPWVAFSVLFWCGYNVAFDARVIAIIETAVIFVVWDWLSTGRSKALYADIYPSRTTSQPLPYNRLRFRNNG